MLTVNKIKEDILSEMESYEEDIIRNIGDGIFYREFYDLSEHDKIIDLEGLNGKVIADYKFEIVDGYGGEGEGDDFWGVAKISHIKNESDFICVRVSGWYASYNGAECDDPEEWTPVKPVQKTITVYEDI